MDFTPGQRWYSLNEPELGLGLIEAVEGRQIVVAYPARQLVRRYSTADPPLIRARLNPGQKARGPSGEFVVEEAIEADGLLHYRGAGQELAEVDLDAEVDVSRPENRLLSGQVDDFRLFDLRLDTLEARQRLLASPGRGFLGGRIRLFDHQLSIAHQACQRHRVRVLLADEVGLGKTIEALLILHRLLLTGRVENALILVPPALVHQWLAEAYLRFNLIFRVIGDDTYEGGSIDPESEDLPQQLLDAQLFICPLGIAVGEAFIDTPWDIALVDEAHYLRPGSDEFALLQRLAADTEHMVFLSATPDRDGEEAHFQRLALLDPARFHDFADYRDQARHYRTLAATAQRLQGDDPLGDDDRHLLAQRLGPSATQLLQTAATIHSRRQLLERLLDLHGLGRTVYRNVRARIPGFPRRRLHTEVLQGDPKSWQREFRADLAGDDSFTLEQGDPRPAWLSNFLAAHPDEKVLVLCANRAKVEAFYQALNTPQRPLARFHEAMRSIERDRQAAWFLDPEGPQAVLSSAVGAEGRNFQVARHLVLLDLPLAADRLEQAIGRIDRIGQGAEIHIHPLVLADSPQQRLCRWYDQALQVFTRPWHGSPAIAEEFGQALIEAVQAADGAPVEALIDQGRRRNDEIIAQLESGRDRLLEMASFDPVATAQLQGAIAQLETSGDLESFMVEAFASGGLDVENLPGRSYLLSAGTAYHRPFPGFHGSEMGVTFDRGTALTHPERILLTWDHPMVRDYIDGLLAQGTGNAAVARLPEGPPGLLLQALYLAEPKTPSCLGADRFLPPTPIAVTVDADGHQAKLAQDAETRLEAVSNNLLKHPTIIALLPSLIERTRTLAEERGPALASQAQKAMRQELQPALARLEDLTRLNPAMGTRELDATRAELEALDQGLQEVRLRLEGLRLIVQGDS
ncbi:MAG: RNA polymerase-associated protein RapA [Candidatus Latescibacteria bacterium]|nr:RNA polymerase-associated protein RapA [Candidatus Latescibacterota bacterium]